MSSPVGRKAREKEQRVRRLRLLAASALAAAAVIAVLIAVSQGGSDGDGGGGLGGGERLTGTVEAVELFEGIPQRGATLGDPDAPVRMVEFVDLQCPFCAQYTRDVLPQLVGRYVRSGRLQIELRPLAFIGDDSVAGAKATASAARQNRIWQFTDIFYRNQGAENSGYVTPEFLRRVARAAGVSPRRAVAASQSSAAQPLLTRASAEARRYGIESTPSFLLARRGEPSQRLEVSRLEPDEFAGHIDALLQR